MCPSCRGLWNEHCRLHLSGPENVPILFEKKRPVVSGAGFHSRSPGTRSHPGCEKDFRFKRRSGQRTVPFAIQRRPNRGYLQLYAGLKQTGQYDLVDDPAAADLVLELQLTAPNGPTNGSKVNGAADPVPMFRLVIYDRKTHYVLWTLTASIQVALLQKTHDRNFDDSLAWVLVQFENLSGRGPNAAP